MVTGADMQNMTFLQAMFPMDFQGCPFLKLVTSGQGEKLSTLFLVISLMSQVIISAHHLFIFQLMHQNSLILSVIQADFLSVEYIQVS